MKKCTNCGQPVRMDQRPDGMGWIEADVCEQWPHCVPEARPIADNPLERGTAGHYWCPRCDGELVDPGPSDTVWRHIFGERRGCTWTE